VKEFDHNELVSYAKMRSSGFGATPFCALIGIEEELEIFPVHFNRRISCWQPLKNNKRLMNLVVFPLLLLFA
jgi:hypothetical protein